MAALCYATIGDLEKTIRALRAKLPHKHPKISPDDEESRPTFMVLAFDMEHQVSLRIMSNRLQGMANKMSNGALTRYWQAYKSWRSLLITTSSLNSVK